MSFSKKVSDFRRKMGLLNQGNDAFDEAKDLLQEGDLQAAREQIEKAKQMFRLARNPSKLEEVAELAEEIDSEIEDDHNQHEYGMYDDEYEDEYEDDYVDNPDARWTQPCHGCGEPINQGDWYVWLDSRSGVRNENTEARVIHDTDECQQLALDYDPPRCNVHDVPMKLRTRRNWDGRARPFWSCGIQEGGNWCRSGTEQYLYPRERQPVMPPPPTPAPPSRASTPPAPPSRRKRTTSYVGKAKYRGKCRVCGEYYEPGDDTSPWKGSRANLWVHARCGNTDILAASRGNCLVCREPIEIGDSIFPWKDITDPRRLWVHEGCEEQPITRIELPDKFKPENFTPSEHQLRIRDTYLKTDQHMIIEAKAGSGKSTTLEWLITTTFSVPIKTMLLMAFNKSIAKELQNRLYTGDGNPIPKAKASTLNSFGYKLARRAYGRPKEITSRKISILAQELFPFKKEDQGKIPLKGDALKERVKRNRKMVKFLQKTIDKIKVNLSAIDEYRDIVEKYKISVEEELEPEDLELFYKTIPILLEKNIESAVNKEMMDFNDQIYLAVVKAYQQDTGKQLLTANASRMLKEIKYILVDVLFVDETQDLNRAQQQMALRTVGDKGRLIAVGDRFQSIYAFSGADSQSMDKLYDMLSGTPRGCVVENLSTTFRCPISVVREAQRVLQKMVVTEEGVPMPVIGPDQETIEAAPGADEGEVRVLPEVAVFDPDSPYALTEAKDAIPRRDRKGGTHVPTMVLCRMNAPIMGAALRLLASGVPVKIVGRDISKKLIDFIDDINEKRNQNIERFINKLNERLEWIAEEEKKLIEQGELDEDRLDTDSPFADEKDMAAAICILACSREAWTGTCNFDNRVTDAPDTVDALKHQLDELFNGGTCPNQLNHPRDSYGRIKPFVADAADEFCPICLIENDERVPIEKKTGVLFSTVHKSKGLEALNIYILAPDRLGKAREDSTEEDQRQEIHMEYVAVTRVKYLKDDPYSGVLTYLDDEAPVPPAATSRSEAEAEVISPPAPERPPERATEPEPAGAYTFWKDEDLTIPLTFKDVDRNHPKGNTQITKKTKGGARRILMSLRKEFEKGARDYMAYCYPDPLATTASDLLSLSGDDGPAEEPPAPITEPSSGIKSISELKKLQLPELPTRGTRGRVEILLSDWREIQGHYAAIGIPSKLVKLPGWSQYALVVNSTVASTTTIDTRSQKMRANQPLKVVGRVSGGRFVDMEGRKILRTENWQGRVIERINAVLLKVEPTPESIEQFDDMQDASSARYRRRL